MHHKEWPQKTIEAVLYELASSHEGLSDKEASERLKRYGPNQLPEAGKTGLLAIIGRQFQSSLIYLLGAASLAMFYLGETSDGIIILIVLGFNALVGTIQEGRAQNTLAALKKFTAANATVLRGGLEIIIPEKEVVPGDILVLQEGERVPADARLILSNNLRIDEAALTGESKPSHKVSQPQSAAGQPADCHNMVFKGTYIVAGYGQAAVVYTSVNTEIGKISKDLISLDTEIPLKAEIRRLSKIIILAVAGISALLFSVGIMTGRSALEMFGIVVALSVSIIPEGLPIVLTLVLATGVWRMSKHNALIRKLHAVEALGQAKVIAVDKTGTLTRNEMVVRACYVGSRLFKVAGVGYEPGGEVSFGDKKIESFDQPGLLFLGRLSAVCSNASLKYSEAEGRWQVAGDPTEASMLVFAEKLGLNKEALLAESPKLSEAPFDYTTKYHAVLIQSGGRPLLVLAGAPETLFESSKYLWQAGGSEPFSDARKKEYVSMLESLSRKGLRVVALAVSNETGVAAEGKVKDLTLVGFLGIQDSLRAEVKAAIVATKAAGIKVIMITGDNKITAEAIAKEAGIWERGHKVITGSELDNLSDEALSQQVENATVFARLTPENKLKIIRAFKKRGEIIAMTGDGVNDASSLVAADLGVAMGKIGTEVAKEAADIVLLDDNFNSLVAAIEEGRSIYKTIKKVLLYLFSTNAGEVLTISAALFLGFPLPILAGQIIWLNLVTDGFLDVALAMEPKEESLLADGFGRERRRLIDKIMLKRIAFMVVPMALGTLILFSRYIDGDMKKAWTISLTTLAAFQWFNAWSCRHESKSVFRLGLFTNKLLLAATVIIVLLQFFAVYHPWMQKLLRTAPLEAGEWLMIIGVASSILWVEEARKLFDRRTHRSAAAS
jgi:Ca2+-transporting ATPase